MKPYKTLLIEDTPSVSKELKFFLGKHSSIFSVPRETRSCNDAINILIEDSFDVSILDIDLIGGTCFDIIDKIPRNKFGEIVFFTRFADKFIKEYTNARPIFYLEKPLEEERVKEMVITIDEYLTKIQAPLDFLDLWTPDTAKKIIVSKSDIIYLEYISTTELVKYTFRELNEKYPEIEKNKYSYKFAFGTKSLVDQIKRLNNQFVQCNKQGIINLSFLTEYENNTKEGLNVLMPNGKIIEISKAFKKETLRKKGIS